MKKNIFISIFVLLLTFIRVGFEANAESELISQLNNDEARNFLEKKLLQSNIKIKTNFSSDIFFTLKKQNNLASEKFFLNGEKNRNYQDYQALNSSRLNLKFERNLLLGEQDKFLQRKKIIGFDAKFESENSANQDKHFVSVDQSYFYFHDSDVVSVEVGDVESVFDKMKAASINFVKGGGGINGNYIKFLTIPTSAEFILIPQSPINHLGKAAQGDYLNKNQISVVRNQNFNGLTDATKINIISPRINNFKIAASYTPNTSKSIVSNSVFNDSLSYRNVYNLAINYLDNFQNIDYVIAVNSERGEVDKNFIDNEIYHDLNAYEISSTFSYLGLTAGVNYGNWGKTGLKKNEFFSDSDYLSTAISYQIASFSIALSDFRSSFKNNDFKVNAVSIDYKINKNFTPFIQLSKYQFLASEKSEFSQNQGYIFLTGFSLNF